MKLDFDIEQVDADELARRLQRVPETYELVNKLLKGSVLRLLEWFKCQESPPRCFAIHHAIPAHAPPGACMLHCKPGNPSAVHSTLRLETRCGEIERQPSGWLTEYQVGHESWPSCSDFTRESGRGAQACEDIDINMLSSRVRPGLFDLADRDKSGYLDRNELEALQGELEARRRVLEKEIWSRMQQSQRDLFKIKPLESASGGGLEFASPHCSSAIECADARYATTLRISSWSEWLGEYIRLGQSRYENVTSCANPAGPGHECGWHMELQPLSHVHIDGAIEGSCPLELSGDSEDASTSICLEKPTAPRSLLLPDASGMVITNATLSDISSLVGLRGDRTLQFTGEAHAHSSQWKYSKRRLEGPVPPTPRIDCSAISCLQGPAG